MLVTGVQGPDMLFEISVVNLLSIDFDFANTLPCLNSYFSEGTVNCVYFYVFKSRLYYLLRTLNSSLMKITWF